jgi:hypothetical protein
VREILDHFHQEEVTKKNRVLCVVEKFKKRGINVSACKPRAAMSLSAANALDNTKNLFRYGGLSENFY